MNSELNTFENISVEKLKSFVEGGSVKILDIRDEQSFQEGHIPDAIHLNNGNIIDNLSRVQLRLYIRGNLTVASAQWNACEQAYLLSVNEQTRDGVKLCAPYRVIVYELKSGSIDTSNVIYDSNNDSGHNVNSNSSVSYTHLRAHET